MLPAAVCLFSHPQIALVKPHYVTWCIVQYILTTGSQCLFGHPAEPIQPEREVCSCLTLPSQGTLIYFSCASQDASQYLVIVLNGTDLETTVHYRAAVRKQTRNDYQKFRAALLSGDQLLTTKEDIHHQSALRIRQLLESQVSLLLYQWAVGISAFDCMQLFAA